MATIYTIAEDCRKMMGEPANAPKFTMEEVKAAAIQVINFLIKGQHLTEEMATGESIPDGSILAEYDNVEVESYKNVSRATLPAMPVKLPLNMGIFHVGKTDTPLVGFIPLEPGQLQMIGSETLLSDILGQVGYEPNGKYILFNKDITLGDSNTKITKVLMRLAVKDLSQYNDFEMLPIPASMEWEVIEGVFKMLTGSLPTNKKVDVTNKQQ